MYYINLTRRDEKSNEKIGGCVGILKLKMKIVMSLRRIQNTFETKDFVGYSCMKTKTIIVPSFMYG